jgi:PhnB protein
MSQKVIPYLLYEDVAAAIDWLSEAFGFREELRYVEPDGRISHAEVRVDDAAIMLGGPGSGYQNPRHTGHVSQLVVVQVDDADAHYERAKAAGATILAEPADQPYGDRAYRVEDPEGHHWSFHHPIASPTPEEWGAQRA